MKDNILHIYRTGGYFADGCCLDKVAIRTEHYEDFERTFNQQKTILEREYAVQDDYNNPFQKTNSFLYWFEGNRTDYVYVEEGDDKENIVIGTFIRFDNCETTMQVLQKLTALQSLKERIVELFRAEYEKGGEE